MQYSLLKYQLIKLLETNSHFWNWHADSITTKNKDRSVSNLVSLKQNINHPLPKIILLKYTATEEFLQKQYAMKNNC